MSEEKKKGLEKKEVVTFDQRLNNLLLALSEVMADIKENKSQIMREMSRRAGVQNEVNAFTAQVDDLKRQIEALKTEKNRLANEIQRLRVDEEIRARDAEAQIARNLESSKKILHDAQKREVALNTEIAEFEAKKKDLEERHAKIAALAVTK